MPVTPRLLTTDDLRGGSYDPYPVGSIYLAVVSTDPATLLGYGTWSAIGAGRVLVGIDSGDTDFDTAEETGGAKTHAHSVTSNVTVGDHASHTHDVASTVDADTETVDADNLGTTVSAAIRPLLNATNTSTGPSATLSHSVTNNAVTSAAGSSVQPYLVVHMWKRTA